MEDREDQPCQERMVQSRPCNEGEMEKVDLDRDGALGVDLGTMSGVSDSIKLLDISNIKANTEHRIQSNYSSIPFDNDLSDENSFSRLVRGKKSGANLKSGAGSLVLKQSP